MAFEGVLTPESLSFAGQAAVSRSLVHTRAPRNPFLDRFPSQGPQVPPPVGKPEWSARSDPDIFDAQRDRDSGWRVLERHGLSKEERRLEPDRSRFVPRPQPELPNRGRAGPDRGG